MALVAIRALRVVLPEQAARAIRSRRCDALMVHWRLVTPRLVRRVRDNEDKRATRLQLTDEGSARLESLTERHLEELERQ